MLNWKTALGVLLLLASTQLFAAGTRLPLWEAQSPDGTTVYLFGSIHVCNASCFPLPDVVLKRLEASQTLVVELDPQRPEAQRELLAAAMLPAGQTLADLLPASEWQALADAANQLGLPAETLAPLQPWMADTLLTLTNAQQAGYETAQGIDLALMQRASKRGLALEELESISTQISAFASGTAAEQRAALRQTVAQVRAGRVPAYLAAMITAWQHGDGNAIERLLREEMPADSSRSHALIEERNAGMAAKLEAASRDKHRRFVVVGVAHLLGPAGIPALLAKHGFRVRQIEAP